MMPPTDYKIAVLVFLENQSREHLLLLRAKPPNRGVWSPIGGKLETSTGESPFECAVRETKEEKKLRLKREQDQKAVDKLKAERESCK